MRLCFAFFILAVAGLLQSCGFAVVGGLAGAIGVLEQEATEVDPSDLKVIHEGSTREEIEEALGAPTEPLAADASQVFIYPYNKGIEVHRSSEEACPMGACLFLFPIYAVDLVKTRQGLVERQKGHLAVMYDDDGRVVAFAPLKSPGHAGEVTELMQHAMEGDAEAAYRLAEMQPTFSARWTWACRAAHRGHGIARYELGNYERFAAALQGQGEAMEAYVWYSLAGEVAFAEDFKEQMAAQMTPEQLSEAKRQIDEWKPHIQACRVGPPVQTYEALKELVTMAEKEQAEAQLTMQAVSGDAVSQYELGLTLSDNTTAWKWFCLAANQGYAEAQYAMGRFSELGIGPVRKNLPQAYAWYQLAHRSGYDEVTSRAKYRRTATGWECCFPDPTRREILAAKLSPNQISVAEHMVLRWEPDPADCEDPQASFWQTAEAQWRRANALGLDLSERRRLICKSAHAGYSAAQRRMGYYFLEPDEPEAQDIVSAYVWLRLADLSDDRELEGTASASIAPRMTPEQWREANRLVKEWVPNPEECDSFGAKAGR